MLAQDNLRVEEVQSIMSYIRESNNEEQQQIIEVFIEQLSKFFDHK